MSIISDQVKSAFANAVNGFLLRLIQSPGTSIGGGLLAAGSIIAFVGTPKAAHWAYLLTGIGGGLMGLNGVSHGFLAKNAGTQTTSFVKVTDQTGLNLNTVGSIPPTPPPPAKP